MLPEHTVATCVLAPEHDIEQRVWPGVYRKMIGAMGASGASSDGSIFLAAIFSSTRDSWP